MNKKELHTEFLKAFEKASNTSIELPPDIMLHFYAYYKHGTHTEDFYTPSGNVELRNAFKLNALLQVKNLTPEEAKLKYIELVNTYIKD